MHHPKEPGEEELLGYSVYALCLEIFFHYSVLGTIAKTDLKAILDILRRKCRVGYGTGNVEADSTSLETKDRYINDLHGT